MFDFQVGDHVAYGDDGVCRVVSMGPLKFHPGADQDIYYTLSPLSYKGVIYLPVSRKGMMRPLITPREAQALLEKGPDQDCEAASASDKKQIADHYRKMLSPGTCQAYARTAWAIYIKHHAPGKGKKLPSGVEMQYFKRACELLVQEISLVLECPPQQVHQRMEESWGMKI